MRERSDRGIGDRADRPVVQEGDGVVFADISISLDGYVAGRGVSLERPLGVGGESLAWYGDDVNDPGADLAATHDAVDARVLEEAGGRERAVIMGRTTFDVSIEAWGDEPPIRKPCFVLTNRPAPLLELRGGTSFTFVSSPGEALREARRVAEGGDVSVMGGAATVDRFLDEGLLDEIQLHVVPVLLGGGVRLFDGVAPGHVRLEQLRALGGARATHVSYRVIR